MLTGRLQVRSHTYIGVMQPSWRGWTDQRAKGGEVHEAEDDVPCSV
jgi:hypothetical protein